jgi:hypothetical protein
VASYSRIGPSVKCGHKECMVSIRTSTLDQITLPHPLFSPYPFPRCDLFALPGFVDFFAPLIPTVPGYPEINPAP